MKTELFNTKGQIYNHFLYILESSIGKIGKTATLNAILKDIAVSGEGKLTALAEKF
ncbi:MAG: hypothetical protein LBG59_08685 [Candidatus Peribacteria bacterium]|jgi:hypothetical protein|nr:hypothetical protein [Candidatus Peribacteria bacterium]